MLSQVRSLVAQPSSPIQFYYSLVICANMLQEIQSSDSLQQKAQLLGSLLLFTRYFFKLKTQKDFGMTHPLGRESHIITICRELTDVFHLKTNRLLINVPPGHFKSTLLQYFISWCMARYPDSNFLYISHSVDLATKHTSSIREIMSLPQYKRLFGVWIKSDSSAKDNFSTNYGGIIRAFGSAGGIVGQDAGLPFLNRFSGGVIMDDMHKPDEVHSPTVCQSVIDTFNQTIKYRRRGENVPFIYLGQRLAEHELAEYLISGKDGYKWKKVILKAIDDSGNALAPEIISLENLRIEETINEYNFAAQYQQNPLPAGGGIFKPEWWEILEEEPNIISTFITCDTAETSKNYNDATVFSFWGVYKVYSGMNRNIDTETYGLHWIDCVEIRVEPSELEPEFWDFFAQCMTHKVKPDLVAIEKKSTGTTLLSVLKKAQGLNMMDIERSKASLNKVERYGRISTIVAQKRISLPAYGKHKQMCLDHMRKITRNNTHRHDDIADTLYDAVKIALIDEIVIRRTIRSSNKDNVYDRIVANMGNIQHLRESRYAGSI